MEIQGVLMRLPPRPWHQRPDLWLIAAVVGAVIAVIDLVLAVGTARWVLAAALACGVIGALLMRRELRAGRAQMIAMIDASIAARDADPRGSPEEQARIRAELMELRRRGGRLPKRRAASSGGSQ
jgi:membrane protein implicated in regulation of membrane protease activity